MSVDAAVDLLDEAEVVRLGDLDLHEVRALLGAYGMRLALVRDRAPIPGSYWGGAEAGLIENDLFARADTPAHSLLHELCHYVCMDSKRRAALATDAHGDDDEECAVCYLQLLLARELSGLGRDRCIADMDAWGYSFREGSTRAWLDGDARFAREWLLARGLIDADDRPTRGLRTDPG